MKLSRLIISCLLAVLWQLLSLPLAHAGVVEDMIAKSCESSVSMNYSYACTEPKGRTLRGHGTLSCMNGMLKILNDPYAIYDNGVEKITLNKTSKEAVREKSTFSATSADVSSILRLLGFNPKSAVISPLHDKNGKENGVSAVLKDGTKLSVVFTNVKYGTGLAPSDFTCELSSLGQAWTVTDLR